MDRKMFSLVAGVIFAVVAVFHLVRFIWTGQSWSGGELDRPRRRGRPRFFRVETCRARCTL